MLEAAKGFRHLKAHKQLPILKAALLKHREPGITGIVSYSPFIGQDLS